MTTSEPVMPLSPEDVVPPLVEPPPAACAGSVAAAVAARRSGASASLRAADRRDPPLLGLIVPSVVGVGWRRPWRRCAHHRLRGGGGRSNVCPEWTHPSKCAARPDGARGTAAR